MYDASTIIKGQGLTYGATTVGAVLIDIAALGADFVGVAHETVTASTTALATGTIVYGKTILNPDAVYLCQWDDSATYDVNITSSTTAAVTIGTTDDNMDGGWIYINSGTGAGQLGFIGAASTTVMTLDTTTAFDVAPASDSDCLLIRRPWKFPANSGNDLSATFDELLSDEDCTGEILILENYIVATSVPFGPLRPRQHHALSNLNNCAVKFYSDIYFTDAVLRGATTMA
jgi:hypothetical protein